MGVNVEAEEYSTHANRSKARQWSLARQIRSAPISPNPHLINLCPNQHPHLCRDLLYHNQHPNPCRSP